MTNTKICIAICGSGASARILSSYIINSLGEELFYEIYIIGNKRDPGPAYRLYSDKLILNAPPDKMSLNMSTPHDFIDWLDDNYPDLDDVFVKRTIYGDYINDFTNTYLSNNKNFSFIEGVVYNIEYSDNKKFSISIDSKDDDLQVDYLILATGNYPPATVSSIENHPHYIQDVWTSEHQNYDIRKHLKLRCNSSEKILFIGSGKTAADAVYLLREGGLKNDVIMISRTGLISTPFVPIEFEEKYKRLPYFDELDEMTDFVLNHLNIKLENEYVDWRERIDNVSVNINSLYQKLSYSNRIHFWNKIRPIWNILRHRMATPLAKFLYTDENLELLTGNIVNIRTNNEQQFIVTYQNDQIIHRLIVDRIVNAKGPAFMFKDLPENSIIRLMINDKVIGLDELGAPFINSRLQYHDHCHKKINNLFGIGPITRGINFVESQAIEDIKRQALILTKTLIDEIRSG